MKIQSSTRRRSRIEIIPLIDIMFFLLATFMMVSLSMIKNQSIPVKLPKAASGKADQRNTAVTVTVSERGDIYVGKEKVSRDDFKDRLLAMKQKNADLKVFVNADKQAHFGDTVQVLDELRRMGIEKVAIQTTGASH